MTVPDRCTECGGALERGRLTVSLEGSTFPVAWSPEAGERPVEGPGDRRSVRRVSVRRCTGCGSLRLYADRPGAGDGPG